MCEPSPWKFFRTDSISAGFHFKEDYIGKKKSTKNLDKVTPSVSDGGGDLKYSATWPMTALQELDI